MQRRYITVDVFTDRAFGGNPLAVVLDAGGLSTAQMQSIASEFNYSETTFVLPPQDPTHDAQVRIFTVNREISLRGPSQCRHRLRAGDAGVKTAGAAKV
jgi:trans-2,3-dihydro-3-hydroxyanthranilate isomerase